MESHILNTYHQAQYRTIGHKVMRAKSDSLSSSESYNHNSPKYAQIESVRQLGFVGRTRSEDSNGEEWCQNERINTTHSSHDTSSDEDSSQEEVDDEEDNIVAQEVNIDDINVDNDSIDTNQSPKSNHNAQYSDINFEDSLVEGHDYDVITVYTVNPDLDLIEASSDEDDDQSDFAMENDCVDSVDSIDHDSYIVKDKTENAPNIRQQVLDILSRPIETNVDDYLLKNKDILDTDGPVVNDVDEYFIKDIKKPMSEPNVDDFLIKDKVPKEEMVANMQFNSIETIPSVKEFLIKPKNMVPIEDVPFKIAEPLPTVEKFLHKPKNLPLEKEFKIVGPTIEEYLIKPKNIPDEDVQFKMSESLSNAEDYLVKSKDDDFNKEPLESENIDDVSINESDLERIPKIEDIKRYLLDDMPYCVKFKNIQRSCSVPQSPMQSLLDIEDAKTCLSFEDLNLDLSDLSFDKSDNANKSDDIPHQLTDEDVNSFLITNKEKIQEIPKDEDDLNPQDMEFDNPVATVMENSQIINRNLTSTPLPGTQKVLDFCIEKSASKETKADDDFVDVEMCNDTVIPVLEANNLSSLLEQFEATEKMNLKKHSSKVADKAKINKQSLTNGMRLHDAGVHLNKNKMRQILMPSTINTTVRSPSPVRSDHDYCSTTKKRPSLPNLKKGQSLLKPEVLSSNNKILNSRHRSCKDKKIVYHLSSDDESEKNCTKNKKYKNVDESNIKKKIIKETVRLPAHSNFRKKLSPTHSVSNDLKDKSNSSVIVKSACKAGDLACSQNSNGSIKLTIKNKSEVILNNCDFKDSQKQKTVEKAKPSAPNSDSTLNSLKVKQEKNKEVDLSKVKNVNKVEIVSVKEESSPKDENFYTALFSNKLDVQVPQPVKVKKEKTLFEDELNKIAEDAIKKELEQPLKKKKLNFQEYKLRKGANSSNSSTTVSPESIFPDMPVPLIVTKVKSSTVQTSPNGTNVVENSNNEVPKKIFDPIREASRKILMNSKKQKAAAMRKRDEYIVMSKIPKVENLELQPLISDAEMMKIVGMSAPENRPPVEHKRALPIDYLELIFVSVGTNTDDKVFKKLEIENQPEAKCRLPQADPKSLINFKIKTSDHVLKQNVFDNMKRDRRNPLDEKKQKAKIDKERYKDITATLKSVEKQVETKISSNSLFASIQDVVMKKAPDEAEKSKEQIKQKSPLRKQIKIPVRIIREYNAKAEHGEDKVILYLNKDRCKPKSTNVLIQTDPIPKTTQHISEEKRQRNDSDMPVSTYDSTCKNKQTKTEDRISKTERLDKKPESTLKRSRSRERYRRRSRSVSRGRRRRHSISRSRSRSHGRFRRYRRSDSPYKRKRRSISPYHKRRSPARRDLRSEDRSKSPVAKKAKVSPIVGNKNSAKPTTQPLRKPTVSESSESSTSSSSSSSCTSSSLSSNASRESKKSFNSCSSHKRDELYKNPLGSFSSEDRDNNTPVEERRIVFVGRLDKDTTKLTLKNQFSKFGRVIEVRLHSKEDGSRYGFVTYMRARDAWSAVEAANTFPQYDVGFGGRRAFCRQSYADLDGLEATYTENAFHGQTTIPTRRADDMSFEQMLQDIKKKLHQRKNDMNRTDDVRP